MGNAQGNEWDIVFENRGSWHVTFGAAPETSGSLTVLPGQNLSVRCTTRSDLSERHVVGLELPVVWSRTDENKLVIDKKEEMLRLVLRRCTVVLCAPSQWSYHATSAVASASDLSKQLQKLAVNPTITNPK